MARNTLRKGRRVRRHSKRTRGGSVEADETAVQYVSSRGILKSCDIIPANIKSSATSISIDLAAIQPGSVVYFTGSAIHELLGKMDSIPNKFILVSGDCDNNVPGEIFNSDDDFKKFIESDKIIHWFSQNVMKEHPKLSHIPIGLYYHVDPHPLEQEKELMQIRDAAKPVSERELLCYSNFHFTMGKRSLDVCSNYKDRDDAKAAVPSELVYYEPSKIPKLETWANQAKYAFVLSPHGCGLDCHRTWEALCLGCIPIVKTSGLDRVYDGLPVLIVKEWSDVTHDLLKATLDSFGNKKFETERLTLAYWMGVIRSKKQGGGGKKHTRYLRKYSSKRLRTQKVKTYKAKGGSKKRLSL